jgi:hypothetical protein
LQQHDFGPEIKKSIAKNGRDVLVILDRALRHPIVVTGVSKFARSQGIPYSEALLQLASLGLAKIIESMANQDLPDMENGVEEVDASELERKSHMNVAEAAQRVGKESDGKPPDIQNMDLYSKL